MKKENNNSKTVNKKNNRIFLFLFPSLFILIAILIYLFRDTIINSFKKLGSSSENSQNQLVENTNENSIFNQLVSEGVGNNDYESIYTPEIRTNLDMAYSIEGRYRDLGDGSWDSLIEVDQAVLQVNQDTDGELYYTFISSKNPNFQFEKDEIVNIIPTVKSPKSLVVRGGDTVNFDFQEEDFNDLKKDIFKPQDKLIFICNLPSCEDGVLDWLLVFRN